MDIGLPVYVYDDQVVHFFLISGTSASLELVSESTFCQDEFIRVKQNSGFGIIHSPNTLKIDPCCSLEFRLCPGCRIHLTFPKNKTFCLGLDPSIQ